MVPLIEHLPRRLASMYIVLHRRYSETRWAFVESMSYPIPHRIACADRVAECADAVAVLDIWSIQRCRVVLEIAQTNRKIPVQLPGFWLLFNKNLFTEFFRFFIFFFWKYVILNERFSAQLYVVCNIHCRYKYFYMILFSPSDIESFDTNKIYARKTFTKYISSICAARLNAKIVTETYHRYMCESVVRACSRHMSTCFAKYIG